MHLPHKINPHADQQQYRERADQQLADKALRLRLQRIQFDAIFHKYADQRVVIRLGADRVVLQWLARPETDSLVVRLDLHEGHLAIGHLLEKLGVWPRLGITTANARQPLHYGKQDDDDNNEDEDIFSQIIHNWVPPGPGP